MVSPVFSVKREAPELIVPATATPREVKRLSDIDDQEGLRFQIPVIFFYRNTTSTKAAAGKDPVKVIREALSKALVFYYPLAGRLREAPNRKLLVDCNSEGVLFIEAEANVTIDELGEVIRPPFPYINEVLSNVPGSDGIVGCPLLLMQVTRLTCGGFILALRLNHTMSDGFGFMQFLKTMAEIVQGAHAPSIMPVWQREVLDARHPPHVTCIHNEYEQVDDTKDTLGSTNLDDLDHKSFYFSPQEISSLRNQLPLHLRNCSTFDLLTACVWKCRTVALQLDPDQIVRFSCMNNVRSKRYKFDLPKGYYGNAFALLTACSKAELLYKSPLGYAVELVRKAKAQMSGEYIKSVADLMVTKGRPSWFTTIENLIVSDITKIGLAELDFGWGEPVYAGTIGANLHITFCLKCKSRDGEDGVLVPLCLPKSSMERFQEELKTMTKGELEDSYVTKSTEILSRL